MKGRDYLIKEAIDFIYEDYYGDEIGIEEYFSIFGLQNSSDLLQNMTLSNFRFHNFNNDISEENIKAIKKKHDVVYIVVLFQNTFVLEQGWEPVKVIHSCGSGFYCLLKSKIKEEEAVLFIYKQ